MLLIHISKFTVQRLELLLERIGSLATASEFLLELEFPRGVLAPSLGHHNGGRENGRKKRSYSVWAFF